MPKLVDEAFNAWARVGTVPLVEDVYTVVIRAMRGLLDTLGVARRLVRIFSGYSYALSDLLAVNRVLTLVLGWSLPDAGVVIFVENPRTALMGGPRLDQPINVLLSREVEGVRTFFALVKGSRGRAIDLDTMGVIPYVPYSADAYEGVEVKHVAQLALESGYSLSTSMSGAEYAVGEGGPCPPNSNILIAPRPIRKVLNMPTCSLRANNQTY